jgi:hypothetical protein
MIEWFDCFGASLAGAAFASKSDEYKHEARRARRIVKGILDGMDEKGVVIEWYVDKPIHNHECNGFGVVICAPNLDENNLGAAAAMAVREYAECVGMVAVDKMTVGKMMLLGTNGDES